MVVFRRVWKIGIKSGYIDEEEIGIGCFMWQMDADKIERYKY